MPQMKCNYVYVAGLNKGNECGTFCRSGREQCSRHTDEAREKHAISNKKQNDKITEKRKNDPIFNCPCGSVATLSNKSKHFKTKKHLEFIENQVKAQLKAKKGNKQINTNDRKELHLPIPKMTCACGSVISEHHKSDHLKTAKHQQYINENQASKSNRASLKRRRPINQYKDKSKDELDDLLQIAYTNKDNLGPERYAKIVANIKEVLEL